jgi:primosomal protein N'
VLTFPRCLPPYYLLYKFHASRGEMDAAHEVARKALAAAALQAHLAADWRAVQPGDADFSTPGPARFWLFTLKALAFINVRRGERAAALALVVKLRALDPADRIGFGVVEALLARS